MVLPCYAGFILCLILSTLALLFLRRQKQRKGTQKDGGGAERVGSSATPPSLTGVTFQNGFLGIPPSSSSQSCKSGTLPAAFDTHITEGSSGRRDNGHPFTVQESGMVRSQQDITHSSHSDSSPSFSQLMQRSSSPPLLPSLRFAPPDSNLAGPPRYLSHQHLPVVRSDAIDSATAVLPKSHTDSHDVSNADSTLGESAHVKRVPYDQWRFGL